MIGRRNYLETQFYMSMRMYENNDLVSGLIFLTLRTSFTDNPD
jgi:hypothetical protein